MTDRLSKHQLKDDALITQTAKTADYVAHHARLVFIAAGVLIVAAAAVLFIRANARGAEERAAAILQQAQIDFDHGDMTAATGRLDQIVVNHGGTRAGKRALLLHADVEYAQGNYAEAQRFYSQAADIFAKDPLLGASAMSGEAASLENLGRYDEAAALYQKLAAQSFNEVLKADNLLAAARNLIRAQRTADAQTLLKQVADMNENPRAAQEAKMRLAELDALSVKG